MFYHGEKYCGSDIRCGACSEIGHRREDCNAEALNCPHCSGEHAAGDKRCPEMKFQQEVLIVQSNEGVSRQQAAVIVKRDNPGIMMNFTQAVAEPRPQREGTPAPRNIDIMCQSPSGRIYKKTIEDPRSPVSEISEIEMTSENNPSVRSETKRMFDAYEANEDLEQFQMELKRVKQN